MKITHNEIEYEVSPLGGWQSYVYLSIALDMLKILTKEAGVEEPENIEDTPHTIIASYEYFTKFCLSTVASQGVFADYNLAGLQNVAEAYQEFLLLFAQPGFYEMWLDAYIHENKEKDDDESQKKEPTGEKP